MFGWDLQVDTKTDVGKDGVSREIHMLGFNHDDLSDKSGKAGISFGTVNCEPATYQMSTEQSNAGGYSAMPLYNNTLPTVFALLSDDLQAVIKKVDKKYANGGGTNYSTTLTGSENIFLFAEIEITGTSSYAQDGENEGSIYEYWGGKTTEDMIKYYDGYGTGVFDRATGWWLRSSDKSSEDKFVCVRSSGGLTAYRTTTNRGVAFGFCI